MKRGVAERIRLANERRIVKHIRAIRDVLTVRRWETEEARTEVVRILMRIENQIEGKEHR